MVNNFGPRSCRLSRVATEHMNEHQDCQRCPACSANRIAVRTVMPDAPLEVSSEWPRFSVSCQRLAQNLQAPESVGHLTRENFSDLNIR